jgi:haloalkane dehalogenase
MVPLVVIARAKGRGHLTVPDPGHFPQEQQPDLLGEAVLGLG